MGGFQYRLIFSAIKTFVFLFMDECYFVDIE